MYILGGDQLTLRNFRGGPVQNFEAFYLPKKLVIFRVGPVKNTLYITNIHYTNPEGEKRGHESG